MRVHNRPSEGTEEEVLFNMKERENEDILDNNIHVDDTMEAYKKEVDEEKSKLTEFKDLEEKSVVKTKDVLFSTNKTHTKTNSNKELKCDICEYVCKKLMTLNKHKNTKHIDQK